MATGDPRDSVAGEAIASKMAGDGVPERCQVCGGYKADETTPGWVDKEHEICDCPVSEEA